ncbi:uncharacterized protein LOC123561605 isoform X2 [Mercenaria mercenaria]|uniref:uncharacterized protein LOC123561605 isoform X2 n=1 Tax=Mercenaria mercenaria TaxID=6596 RepID=UPI00234F1D4B|nr:uncharacterized protein LOC123561605 isoform X2 [Mercenaria mercenaria]
MSKFKGKLGEEIQIKTADGRNVTIIVTRIEGDDVDSIAVEVLPDEGNDSEEITIKLKKNEDCKRLTIKIVKNEDSDDKSLSDDVNTVVSGNEFHCNDKLLAEFKQESVDLQNGQTKCGTDVVRRELPVASKKANEGERFEEGIDRSLTSLKESRVPAYDTAKTTTKSAKNKYQCSLNCINDGNSIPKKRRGSSSAERQRKHRQKIRNNPELYEAQRLKMKQQNKESKERLKERRKSDKCLDEECKRKQRLRKHKWRQKTVGKFLAEVKQEPVDVEDGMTESTTAVLESEASIASVTEKQGECFAEAPEADRSVGCPVQTANVKQPFPVTAEFMSGLKSFTSDESLLTVNTAEAITNIVKNKGRVKLSDDPSISNEYDAYKTRDKVNSTTESEGPTFIHGTEVINSLNDESKQKLVTFQAIDDIGDVEEITEEELKYFITVNTNSPDS